MAHTHSVYDTDQHFIIDPITRAITTTSKKVTLTQGDHNSERFTFELPRHIEGHDMMTCNRVQVHYLNVDSLTREQSADVYEVADLAVSPDDEEVVIFSWLIHGNATRYAGPLSFTARFMCVTEDDVDYAWNTAIHTGVNITNGINNSEIVAEEYSDILQTWWNRLYASATLSVAVLSSEEFQALTDRGAVEEGTLYLLSDDPSLDEIKSIEEVRGTVPLVFPYTVEYNVETFADFAEKAGDSLPTAYFNKTPAIGDVFYFVAKTKKGDVCGVTAKITENPNAQGFSPFSHEEILLLHSDLEIAGKAPIEHTHTADDLTDILPIGKGGTGTTTEEAAREALGADDAGNITKGTLPIERGGTGKSEQYINSVLVGDNKNPVKNIYSVKGAFHSLGTSQEPIFATLPLSCGGTGATSKDDARNKLGFSKSTEDAVKIDGKIVYCKELIYSGSSTFGDEDTRFLEDQTLSQNDTYEIHIDGLPYITFKKSFSFPYYDEHGNLKTVIHGHIRDTGSFLIKAADASEEYTMTAFYKVFE